MEDYAKNFLIFVLVCLLVIASVFVVISVFEKQKLERQVFSCQEKYEESINLSKTLYAYNAKQVCVNEKQ